MYRKLHLSKNCKHSARTVFVANKLSIPFLVFGEGSQLLETVVRSARAEFRLPRTRRNGHAKSTCRNWHGLRNAAATVPVYCRQT
ncbi:unnamed protein product [Ixodes pacificus]